MSRHLSLAAVRRGARLAATAAACSACVAVQASPTVLDLSTTRNDWTVWYQEPAPSGAVRSGPAFQYDCAGVANACLSVTSNGFVTGTGLGGADPAWFPGDWVASLSFSLPGGIQNARFDFNLLGIDDFGRASLNGTQLFAGERLFPYAGFVDVSGLLLAGDNVIEVFLANNPVAPFGEPVPLSAVDGTALAMLASLTYETQPVSSPPTLATALLGLVLLGATRARRGRVQA